MCVCVFGAIGEMCAIYVGVTTSGRVHGVQMGRKERDVVGVAIDSIMHKNISPAVKHNMYKVLLYTCIYTL